MTRPVTRPVTRAVTRAIGEGVGGGGFDPKSFFASGELGAIYDPSYFASMWQDSAGTTPVTAVEQIDGKILDLSGNNATGSQATSGFRPNVTARKNRIAPSEDFSSVNWILVGATMANVGATSVGTFTTDTSTGAHRVTNNANAGDGPAVISFEAKPNGLSKIAIKESVSTGVYASFDMTGAGSVIASTAAGATITLLGDGYYAISMYASTTGTVGRAFVLLDPAYSGGDPNGSTFTGDGVSGVLMRYPQDNTGMVRGKYQSTVSSTNYATGFPIYLDFDGIDDKLTTTFPNLGSNVTIARSIPNVGAEIITGQTIGAGPYDWNKDGCYYLWINRPLTLAETASLSAFLDAKGGL